MAGQKFQVRLSQQWQDYTPEENRILMRAYLSGFQSTKFHLRGQEYVYNFERLEQTNVDTGKSRQIRPPHAMKRPSKPLIKEGPTMSVTVPEDAPGKVMYVPHPKRPDEYIAVDVPSTARPGQQMLVSVPLEGIPSSKVEAAGVAQPATAPTVGGKPAKGFSTGAKIAMGVVGVAALGGAVVGGVVLGDAVAEHGWDGVGEAIGSAFEHTGEAIGDFAVDAADWTADAADATGDFIMDLF